jgi:hypothetical protein
LRALLSSSDSKASKDLRYGDGVVVPCRDHLYVLEISDLDRAVLDLHGGAVAELAVQAAAAGEDETCAPAVLFLGVSESAH